MFGRGVEELLDSLPRFEGLDEATVRRLLTAAWLEVAERRELAGSPEDREPITKQLRRLALALESHAVVAPGLDPAVVRACAFVAAEALDIARELDASGTRAEREHAYERLIVGLLYLIAGYDANANVVVRDLAVPDSEQPEEQFALRALLALLAGEPVPDAPDDQNHADLHGRVRGALWRAVGANTAAFTNWLRDPRRPDGDEPGRLLELADSLRLSGDEIGIASHADIQHLARTCAVAMLEASARALRNVPAPSEQQQTFAAFLAARCESQPLLWPLQPSTHAERFRGSHRVP